MTLLLNILWFVFAGLSLALSYAVAGLIAFVLVVTIPFGYPVVKIALLSFNPLGKDVVSSDVRGLLPVVPSGAQTRA